ncbi:hypothetical protein P4V95_15100 [Bacillus thuringiensis]|nr:hypothetical protein [Bacillus thuringiensis]
MGLGMNIRISVVLPYGYSYSDSNRKCDCINVFGVFERIEKAEALPVKQKKYVCRGSSYFTTRKFP